VNQIIPKNPFKLVIEKKKKKKKEREKKAF